MNIKNLLGNSVPVSPVSSASKAEKPIKLDTAQDRDANGQYFDQKERRREKMTDEQFEKALSILREKSFIKDMNWVVVATGENDLKMAWVQDSNGQTIRKISEYDLWEVFDDVKSDETKGQLLKKTA
jgi:hypothetical protein